MYNGTTNVQKFLFFFHSVMMTGKSNKENELSFIGHLRGPTLELYCDNFETNGDLMEYVKNYSIVKESIIDRGVEENIQDVTRQALEIGPDFNDI